MSAILRPTFIEGQVLGAVDLNDHVSYDRLAAVLHERTEHLWGVAQGLTLSAVQQTTASGDKYVDINLLPGRAVDRLGRAIVVTEPLPLDTRDFQFTNAEPGVLFPVFVQATEVPRNGLSQPGKCSTGQATRIEEGAQISFGAPGSELAIIEQEAATVDVGFGTPGLYDKVLVGWATWSKGPGKFANVASSANGHGVRYVGVVASEVVAGGGTLALRTRTSGSRFAVTVTEDSTGGCKLEFGKQDGRGPVSPTFSVDDKGNVAYAGVLNPAPPAKTLAESGVAFDGVCLPLPTGVTQEQVDGGALRLHAMLTPIPQVPTALSFAGGAPTLAMPLVVQCEVDVETDRRVRCKVRWYQPATPATFMDLPGACNYVLVASGK